MGAVKALKLSIFMMFLILAPKTSCQQFGITIAPRPPRPPTPLCVSQIALVNHACSMLPYTAAVPDPTTSESPPSPPLLSSPEGGHEHRNRHRHGSSPETRHQESPIEKDCCRWLKEVDRECVCNLLVQLPPFLSRPVHNYTVVVDEVCSITFQCPGRLLG